MDHPVTAQHHHDHDHHAHHDHVHGHELSALSLLQSSAFLRLCGAILLLIPLWIAVYWVSAS